jgi:hypothetical protein
MRKVTVINPAHPRFAENETKGTGFGVSEFTNARKLGEFIAYLASQHPDELPNLRFEVEDQ